MFSNNYLILALFGSLLLFTANFAIGDTKDDIILKSTSQTKTIQPKTPGTEIEKSRGQLLYENHCGGCHETSVHGRNPRKARSISEIKHWVLVWHKELKLNWSQTDLDDVVRYLNFKYYQYAE